MPFTEREEKVLRLAFDTRTPENEAVAAFLAARKSIPFSRLCDGGSSENIRKTTIFSVPHNCFFLAFDLIYYVFKEHSVRGGSVNLVASESNPDSALFGDIVITYPDSERNRKLVAVVAKKIADEADGVMEKRRAAFSSFPSSGNKEKEKESYDSEYSNEYKADDFFDVEKNEEPNPVAKSQKMSFGGFMAFGWDFAFLISSFLLVLLLLVLFVK